MALGLDLKPLERGLDALVRIADALEDIAWCAKTHVMETHGKVRTH